MDLSEYDDIAEFEEDATCPKCGAFNDKPHAEIHQQWIAGNGGHPRWEPTERVVFANITTRFTRHMGSVCRQDGAEPGQDHLHRTCNLCGYYWSEEVMMTDEEIKEDGVPSRQAA